MSENIEIQLEPFDLAESSNMTLILGSRCIDGVVIIADRKFTLSRTVGIQYRYGDKITGDLKGILTAFSGDMSTFQLFTRTLRVYANNTKAEKKEQLGQTLDEAMLKISEIQNNFYHKYEKHQYRVLMGVASCFFPNHISSLYYFESDGRCFPLMEPKAIGSGSVYADYFLKRYWQDNKTTMKQFAQLGDFIIRYVSHDELVLDNAVGLDNQNDKYQYPQIVYIPDEPEKHCTLDEEGKQRLDCPATIDELSQFRKNSLNMLRTLNDIDVPWIDS
jgi:20S proteasome alpha/beta subunit